MLISFYPLFSSYLAIASLIEMISCEKIGIGGVLNIRDSTGQCKDFVESSRKVNNGLEEFQFTSPNYPNMYPNNVDCIKVIQVPEDQIIELTIRGEFSVESNNFCRNDFLEIRDGKYGFSPLFGIFCSSENKKFEKINSSSNYMWLRFRSDGSLEKNGFKATYRFHKPLQLEKPTKLISYNSLTLDDKNFLIKQDYLKSFTKNRLPITYNLQTETVLELTCPKQSVVALHIHNFTVPKEFQSTCKPNIMKSLGESINCRSEDANGLSRRRRSDIMRSDDDTDPTQTYLEVYTDNTISETSIPCQKIHRLCTHENVTTSVLSTNNTMVLRFLIAAPAQVVYPKPESLVDMFPNVALNVICLQKQVNGRCNSGYRICDVHCIAENYFCNEDFNCKKTEEDVRQCVDGNFNEGRANVHEFVDSNGETDEEELSQATIHMTVLGVIAFILVTVTVSCFVIAFRTKAKQNHAQEKIVIPIQMKESDKFDELDRSKLFNPSMTQNNSQPGTTYKCNLINKEAVNQQQISSKSFYPSPSNELSRKDRKLRKLKNLKNFSQDLCNDTHANSVQPYKLISQQHSCNNRKFQASVPNLLLDVDSSSSFLESNDFAFHEKQPSLKSYQPSIKIIPVNSPTNDDSLEEEIISDEVSSYKSSSTLPNDDPLKGAFPESDISNNLIDGVPFSSNTQTDSSEDKEVMSKFRANVPLEMKDGRRVPKLFHQDNVYSCSDEVPSPSIKISRYINPDVNMYFKNQSPIQSQRATVRQSDNNRYTAHIKEYIA